MKLKKWNTQKSTSFMLPKPRFLERCEIKIVQKFVQKLYRIEQKLEFSNLSLLILDIFVEEKEVVRVDVRVVAGYRQQPGEDEED